MRTVGVEEEFLLLDPATGVNLPVAGRVVAALPESLRRRSRREFRPSMLEMVSDVCVEADDLARQLAQNRGAAGAAAATAGVLLVAVGASPVAEPDREPDDDPRFRAITDFYGPVARDPALCGCHVHVGVDDPEHAVEVCNRLRPDLPLIQALSANSPLCEGADTGYASWRSVQLRRWPALGPWPHAGSVAEVEETVAALVAAGEMMDASMELWWARPSRTFPTVEVRVADVGPAPADAVLLAMLVRGLVETSTEGPMVSDLLLTAAHGNAARSGMGGTLLCLRTGRARPAWDLVGEMVDRIAPALRKAGDLDAVVAGLDRIRREGTGADRQRRLLAAPGTTIPAMLRAFSVSPGDRPATA
nr:glutamate--cysteine ligase [Actinoplanes sp. SE50/110]